MLPTVPRSSLQTEEALQDALDTKYEEDVVFINKVTINNLDFEETYNQAIAEKQNAQLAYERQQIENQTAIEKAEAEAQAKIIAAEGEAEANAKKQQTLTDEIIPQPVDREVGWQAAGFAAWL